MICSEEQMLMGGKTQFIAGRRDCIHKKHLYILCKITQRPILCVTRYTYVKWMTKQIKRKETMTSHCNRKVFSNGSDW